MPTVTAVRSNGDETVSVELDGNRWRTLPVSVAVEARVFVGAELDRPRLRELRRRLRRAEATSAGLRSLGRRELSRKELDDRLTRRGVAASMRSEAVAALEDAGLQSDERMAVQRAQALARREAGDDLIRFDLEQRGVASDLADRAIAELEPEEVRAEAVASRRGRTPQTQRRLAARGFSPDVLEGVFSTAVADGP